MVPQGRSTRPRQSRSATDQIVVGPPGKRVDAPTFHRSSVACCSRALASVIFMFVHTARDVRIGQLESCRQMLPSSKSHPSHPTSLNLLNILLQSLGGC